MRNKPTKLTRDVSLRKRRYPKRRISLARPRRPAKIWLAKSIQVRNNLARNFQDEQDVCMKIAVIGSGISGMVCARILNKAHDVTVFEANDYIGGHTHTVNVEIEDEQHSIDTGFIVFNRKTYPHFDRILDELGVESTETKMSFSVKCDKTGLEYNATSPNGLFAQRRNLLSLKFWRMLRDIIRFNKEGNAFLVANENEDLSVGEFLRQGNYSKQFAQNYLLPMGAAVWSCPFATFEEFPIRFICEFYHNHGFLQIRDRPMWRTINGGSKTYIDQMTAPYQDKIRLSCPVQSVQRNAESVRVVTDNSDEEFDEVVLACHSDTALQILNDADDLERELLSAFPYSQNSAVLHTDTSILPKSRRAWAAWNYHLTHDREASASVTYDMSILQHINSKHEFCVTLNEDESIDPTKVLGRYQYSHPIFTVKRAKIQARHAELIRRRRTSFCGAYWRNGFHEDGVVSALAVTDRFNLDSAM
jgi:predicted NAD/FAD-binding protein